MVSLAMCQTGNQLRTQGYTPVQLPFDLGQTPIPGVILYANVKHQLLWILPDGTTIDLIEAARVYIRVHQACSDLNN